MSDNNPKALTFGGEEHNAPLADISNLSDVQKARLKSKALGAFGTYDYERFKSDEEFELALACLAPYYWGNHEVTDEDIAEYAAIHRGFYYHKKKYRVWEKEVLEPMVKRLSDYALDAPQYDASFLLELEKQKMECMDAYFSHSVTADVNPRNISYPVSQWELDHFNNPTEESDKLHCGRKIYWHKAHRLYYHIRQHALHSWWD